MHPTQYPDLNSVLRELAGGARTILGDNFCGVYLVGSFALGDADEYSDVDFLVVTRDELRGASLEALRTLHRRLFGLVVGWAQHLEGSYAPAGGLRRIEPSPSKWLFLDNGARELVWDTHCNTAVLRWTLREHGIALCGLAPATLVDPVDADELRTEARRLVAEYAAWAKESTEPGGMSRWKQPYLVLTFCRLLHTLESGRVVSKREAGEWALATLDEVWASLVRQALADRPDPWTRVGQRADAELAARTLAFAAHARKLARCD